MPRANAIPRLSNQIIVQCCPIMEFRVRGWALGPATVSLSRERQNLTFDLFSERIFSYG
jgi:hypothetical protein